MKVSVKLNKNLTGIETINGLTNRTFNPASIVNGQAASEDQLAVVASEASKHTIVEAGSNVTVTDSTDAATGATIYTVSATASGGSIVSNGAGITVREVPDSVPIEYVVSASLAQGGGLTVNQNGELAVDTSNIVHSTVSASNSAIDVRPNTNADGSTNYAVGVRVGQSGRLRITGGGLDVDPSKFPSTAVAAATEPNPIAVTSAVANGVTTYTVANNITFENTDGNIDIVVSAS